jgi:signal transduction histidine kinase
MNARKIQSGLALRHTRSEEALDSLAGNMVQMKNQANKGTGLGLAISKQFIEMHGGTISVEKNPAGGATFRIILPCTQVEEAPLPDQDHRDVRIA